MLGLFALLATIAVPAEVKKFIPKEHRAIEVQRGDLNRDGREDYVVVVQRIASEEEPEAFDGDPRPLLILTRQANGSLKLAKKATNVVRCAGCGGSIGDPFLGVKVGPGRFTVHHHGGSGWRWDNNYTFAWSRRDRTWQLVKVELREFHSGEPEKRTTTVHTPPKDFGKIDLGEFDPDDYLGKGPV